MGWECFSSSPRPDGSVAHPASYKMRARGSFPGGKAAGAWNWPLTPSNELYLHSPSMPSWRGAHQGQLYLFTKDIAHNKENATIWNLKLEWCDATLVEEEKYSDWLRAGRSDDRGSIPGGGLGIFLFDTMSRPALGLTQSPIQWVPGALSLEVKRPGREADHSPPYSAEVKECVEL
jgi:hypothetical protein